ncbi:MAG: VCBS repeat-containing protein [Nannocystaceae bacterium]|nr:VCBS repeat-containing protein [Nannocystaceae bacterium]
MQTSSMADKSLAAAFAVVLGGAVSCGDPGGGVVTADGGEDASLSASVSVTASDSGAQTEGVTSSASASAETTVADSSGVDTMAPKFDVGDDVDMGMVRPVDLCHVNDDMDAVGDCEMSAPADSFTPEVQWTFGVGLQSWVTPLVANFTDDDGNGEINLCDIPDVVLLTRSGISYSTPCDVNIIDGATGVLHFAIPQSEQVSCTGTPAIGDIDNDGLPEIVAEYISGGVFRIKAFEHDGTVKWANTTDGGNASQFYRESGAIALHDLDADGDVEIVFNHEVYDHDGNMLWEQTNPNPGELECSTAADLDGDGTLEVITGHSAYHFDGSVYFDNYPTVTSQSIPQVGNLDDDPEPEIFVTSGQGIWMIEHDGSIAYGPVTPTGVAASAYLVWQRPGTIHDFDGDNVSEWASSSQSAYAVYEGPTAGDVLWQTVVQDFSGAAGGTAFDFLGDGIAEAMYADEQNFRIYDGLTGAVQLTIPRQSPTISEYPVVADIDNDGSAEILVVSTGGEPALQAIRDAEDRWIQARRIWNQHAYYVTNVREDGTIPQHVVPNWSTLNTFRTNAQIEGGGLCKPAG